MSDEGRDKQPESIPAAAQAASGVSRGQNAVYVIPQDWASITHFLAPILERVDESAPGLQVLVVTSDAELAAAVAAAAVRLLGEARDGVLAATSARRAARLLKLEPVRVLAGDAGTLLALVRSAAVKLDQITHVALAWADELTQEGADQAPLESLMADVPKECGRTIVTTELTPGVEALIERYARRARRVVSPPDEAIQPVRLEYVTTGSAGRLSVLRRLLDDLDPERALVYVRTDESRVETTELLQSLGYTGARAAVTLGHTAEPGTPLVLLFDLPASREELREAVGAESPRVIAIVQPRQITSLRALAAGGSVQSVTLPQAALRARSEDAAVRDELAEVLARGDFGRELLALEPLLDRYDGIEVAAASLRLLERARHALQAAEATGARGGNGARPSTDMARLFITIGERDGARPGDLVGAITAVAGITSAQIGRIEMRDTHSLVEVAANVADAVAEKVTGTSIRGRRAVARLDQERPRAPRARAERPDRDHGERPARGRGDRPDRPRGERPDRQRGDRPDRDSRGPRGDRPARTNRRDRE